MKEEIIDIHQWTRNTEFYGSLSLVLSIKSFQLQDIRKRYLASRQNKSGRAGSVERRPVGLGGVAAVKIENGKLETRFLLDKLKEPRGLAAREGRLAFSLENRVIVLSEDQVYDFTQPWFSYIHSVSFHPLHKDRLLVSSSGFDCLFEYDYRQKKLLWEWFAWEHDLNEAKRGAEGEPILLTRHTEEARAWKAQGKRVQLIANPQRDSLPTAQRAAFINSAQYDARGDILITLFHEGSVRKIYRQEGDKTKLLLAGLKCPHGGQQSDDESLLCTNTAGGELWQQSKNHRRRYRFHALPHKAAEMGAAEWLQNSLAWGDFFITIDANRNALIIIDPQHQRYDQVPFADQWAVQDLCVLEEEQLPLLQKLAAFQLKDEA